MKDVKDENFSTTSEVFEMYFALTQVSWNEGWGCDSGWCYGSG